MENVKDRIMRSEQIKIAVFVFPLNFFSMFYCALIIYTMFMVDSEAAMNANRSLYICGLLL